VDEDRLTTWFVSSTSVLPDTIETDPVTQSTFRVLRSPVVKLEELVLRPTVHFVKTSVVLVCGVTPRKA
jgi:hypothetical protein